MGNVNTTADAPRGVTPYMRAKYMRQEPFVVTDELLRFLASEIANAAANNYDGIRFHIKSMRVTPYHEGASRKVPGPIET